MKKFIPLSVPNFVGNEKKYVNDVVERAWVSTGGKEIALFEEKFSEYIGVDSAVACQSGTAGLHLSYMLCGIERDVEVLVPDLTFIASINPIKYLNAHPVFMDCDDSLNMDIDKLEDFVVNHCIFEDNVLRNKTSHRCIKAIVLVHVFGNLMALERVMALAHKFNLRVIEDATEALGGYYTSGPYKGRYAGTIGDFGVFSFNGNKIITTGGGGMIVSNHGDLLARAKYLSAQAKDDAVKFVHDAVGYNYRMTNMQAALGLGQLECLSDFVAIKNKNYDYYAQKLKAVEHVKLMPFNAFAYHNKWFYALEIDTEKFPCTLDTLIECFQDQNIQTRPVWGLMHDQKPYVECETFKIDKARYYVKHILNIPCSTNLTFEDIDRVVESLQWIQKGRH